LKQLRNNTKVTYMGEFANTTAATPNAPAAQSALEKGVAGLK
jgi:hypothetical protein